LSHAFSIQNGLKQGEALLPLLFNYTLEYTIRNDHKHQKGMKLNEIHRLLVYANYVPLLNKNIKITKKTHEFY